MEFIEPYKIQALEIWATVLVWLQSPAFYAQIGAIIGAWFIAKILSATIRKRVPFLTNEPDKDGRLFFILKWVYKVRELLKPLLLIAALAVAVSVLDASVGTSWLARLAQSLAVVLALNAAIKLFIPAGGLQRLIQLVVLPSALLMVFGQFDAFTTWLDTVALELGNIRISALFMIKAAIFGGILFWLGRQSNKAGQGVIQKQDSLDLSMKSLVGKLFEIALFIIIGIVFLQLLGVDLTALAVLGGAVGVGLGFGLQQIAANFISGMIILFERSLSPGDFIEMEDGKSGILKEINMRSTTLETYDGKEIMLPNEKFITTTFVNWTRDDPRQRYEVEFSVAYDTDLEPLPDLIVEAVSQHPQVLDDPEPVDVELRSFDDSGIRLGVEFWADGIDDGKNKFSSDVLFIIWRTLRDNDIKIPFPQREIRIIGDSQIPTSSTKKPAKQGKSS
ncbi:MAG: mechanosensitive ion channel domain-containing protein [Hyphomicrobiales bacterium]